MPPWFYYQSRLRSEFSSKLHAFTKSDASVTVYLRFLQWKHGDPLLVNKSNRSEKEVRCAEECFVFATCKSGFWQHSLCGVEIWLHGSPGNRQLNAKK